MTQPEDGEYGIKNNKSEWSGMVGMLDKRKIDIGIEFFQSCQN